jgi:hypothetical protein
MAHKEHKDFNATVFKQLCDEVLENLSDVAKNDQVDWEIRHIAVLEQLLKRVRDYCGVYEGFKMEDLRGYPLSLQLKQKIIGIVDFDSVHEHASSVFFYKQPIIEEFVVQAIGKNPNHSNAL